MIESRKPNDQRREQEAADRALRALFAGAPYPELPPSFPARCAHGARLAPAARSLGTAERIILRAYWAITAVASVAMLARIDWPLGCSPIVAAGAALSVAAALLPTLLFARMRGGVLALLRRVTG